MSGSTSSGGAPAPNGPPRGTLLSLADGTAVCFFSHKGLLAVTPADCGAQYYVLRSVDLVVSPQRRGKVGPTELPTVPTECIFTVHHVGDNVVFRSVGAEGRILQSVNGHGEHRLANYNMGPWEQWEHDAQHGLVNVHWRKPLGFGLQTIQTALFDDLKEQERRLLRDARLMGAAVRAAEAREADLLRRVKEAQAAAGGYFEKVQPSTASQPLQRKLQAAEAAREAAESALAEKSAELERVAKARAKAEAAASDSRAELLQVRAERSRLEAALQEAEATHNEAIKAKDRFERMGRRDDASSEELLSRVAAAEARALESELRAAESDRRAAESDKRAAEAERCAAAMQAERDQAMLGAERERDHVARELDCIRLKAAAVRQESHAETRALARQHSSDAAARHAAELASIPEVTAAKPASLAPVGPVPFEFHQGEQSAPVWGTASSVQPTTPLFGAVPRTPKTATGRTPLKVGHSSSKPALPQVGSAAWERALDQVQAIMPTTATPIDGKEGLATPSARRAELEDGEVSSAVATRRRGPTGRLGSCLCPGGSDQGANGERAPLVPQNGPAPPRARNSVGFVDGTPQHTGGTVQAQRAAFEAQSTSKPPRAAYTPAATAGAPAAAPPSRTSFREAGGDRSAAAGAAGAAAPERIAAVAPPSKAVVADAPRQHYPRYGQPTPGDEEEVAERAPQAEDDDVALDWNLHSARRAPEADASAARGPARAFRTNDPDLCTPAVPIHGGQCGFATNIAVVRGGITGSVEESAGSNGETSECGNLRAPGSARKRLDMAAAVSDAPADGPAAALSGDCSASTSPISAPRPAQAAKRSLAAPRNVGWGVPISEQDENREPEQEARPPSREPAREPPPQPQQQRPQHQVQRGHGLPVRAVSSSSSGLSGGSAGAPRAGSSGSSFRSGSSGGGGGSFGGGCGSYGQAARHQPAKEKSFAPALPGHAKSINDAMAAWGPPASGGFEGKFGTSREALQEVSMNDLFMGLWSPGKGARSNMM